MKIIQNRKIWFSFSITLTIISVLLVVVWGMKPSIDFKGGSLMELEFTESVPTSAQFQAVFENIALEAPIAQSSGDKGAVLRFAPITEEEHHSALEAISAEFGEVEETRFDSIGPAVGKELFRKSVASVLIVIIVVITYIGWSFRKVAKTVPAWVYGTIVIVAFLHDVIIPLGVFAWLGHFRGTEVGGPFIAAILMILGYSINDTIVVLDRVRENLRKVKGTFAEIVEASVHQTFNRSINTSLTTLLVLIAVMIFGGSTLGTFALALIIGVVFGTYSSIFIAAPLLITWHKLKGRK